MAAAFQPNSFQENAFQVENPAAVGNAGAIFASWESARPRRNEAEVQRDREHYGLPKRVDEAIEELLARQEGEAADAAEMEAALRRELKLKNLAYRAKYMEALAARMEAELEARKAFVQQQRNMMILIAIAAAAT